MSGRMSIIFIYALLRAEMARIFADANIPTSIIMDSAVGSVMEGVDMVICGAEGVMENGGIVNKVSLLSLSFMMTLIVHFMNSLEHIR